MRSSHAVAEHDILLGQFQQHGIIEEFVDTHVFTQTLQQHTSPITIQYRLQSRPKRQQ